MNMFNSILDTEENKFNELKKKSRKKTITSYNDLVTQELWYSTAQQAQYSQQQSFIYFTIEQ